MTFENYFTNYIAELLHEKLDKTYTSGEVTEKVPQEIVVRSELGNDPLFLKPNAIFLLSKVGGAERSDIPNYDLTKVPILFNMMFDVSLAEEVKKAVAEISKEKTGFTSFSMDGKTVYAKLSFGLYSFQTPFDNLTQRSTNKAVLCSWFVSVEYSLTAFVGGLAGTLTIDGTEYPLNYLYNIQHGYAPNYAQRLEIGSKNLDYNFVNNSTSIVLSIAQAANDDLQNILKKASYGSYDLASKTIVYKSEGETFTAKTVALTRQRTNSLSYFLLTLTR